MLIDQRHRDLFVGQREAITDGKGRLDDREQRVHPLDVGERKDGGRKRRVVLELQHDASSP